MTNAYVDGLKLLARGELSEAQLRARLARRGFDPDAIDRAVERLRSERALDDRRAAEAIARAETTVRSRGPARVRQRLEAAGIDAETARHAVDRAFEAADADTLLQRTLDKRLGGRPIADDRELNRLYRYLVTQGFDPDRVAAILERHRQGQQEH